MIDRLIRFVALPSLLASYLAGVIQLTDYSSRPSAVATNVVWSDVESLVAEVGGDTNVTTILFFYQPGCPCTVASARSLQRACPLLNTPYQIIAFAYLPEDAPADWIDTRTSETLLRISPIKLIDDAQGMIAQSLGITTSGHCLVLAPRRGGIFSGGLTSLRGHEGTGPSLTQFIHSINDASEPLSEWPVFGCSISSTL
ncbi:hypothetical protein [Rhodopirellula sp. MGV]|uniref:hypothetical protein n=1 Tax=Rhodopirellula sp. MGV TaxID=2023130 RepID=UPI000B95DCE2|nr:hypothetical protein [Rhodopirellula sp. MGV]OYP33164.1 hypothetical protein CGZ80_18245 [Rhodopirellula sp. MGV]PNY35108.1 hypothetical protein C2E31_19575 [Rhodopirellula baltica]